MHVLGGPVFRAVESVLIIAVVNLSDRSFILLSLTLSGAGRRREPRVSGHELVVAHWTDSDGRARAERARIVDRSKKGLGLHLTVPIPVGVEVNISGGTTVRARVRHCRADGEAYTVGLHRLSADTC